MPVGILGALSAAVISLALLCLAVLIYQGKRPPKGRPQFVALGSSFAAGIGLGPRDPGSPYACMRSINGYPQQLARLLNLSLVDVSSSGATTKHVMHGGQYFQAAQLDAIDASTELVTLTIGGNDVRYVGDLSMLAAQHDRSLSGWLLRKFWGGPRPVEDRNFAGLQDAIRETLEEVRRRAPHARIVAASYPTIVSPHEVCDKLGLTEPQAKLMYEVGARLAQTTRLAAQEANALYADIELPSTRHHACAPVPWVNGWKETVGTAFHPTLLGAEATAHEIARILNQSSDVASAAVETQKDSSRT